MTNRRQAPALPAAAAGGFNEMYSGTPPWDIGRPQPAVVRLAQAGAFEGAILDAGCGTGENSLYVASRGLEVVGLDGAPRAIAQARAKAKARNVPASFVLGDALNLEALGQAFDRVLDCGLFHVFDDADRARYVGGVAAVLRPGGRAFVLCFSDKEPPGWGPRRVPQAEIRAAFKAGFRVESIVPERFESHIGAARAWCATLRRL
jgi:SAM-dependent methyltransferase